MVHRIVAQILLEDGSACSIKKFPRLLALESNISLMKNSVALNNFQFEELYQNLNLEFWKYLQFKFTTLKKNVSKVKDQHEVFLLSNQFRMCIMLMQKEKNYLSKWSRFLKMMHLDDRRSPAISMEKICITIFNQNIFENVNIQK